MKQQLQKVVFTISVVSAILNPLLDEVSVIKYILLVCSLFYLAIGWFTPLLRDAGGWLENLIVGFIYATVLFAGYLHGGHMPFAKYLTIFGFVLALSLMIYALIQKNSVRKDMLIQAIILFLISPIPLWP